MSKKEEKIKTTTKNVSFFRVEAKSLNPEYNYNVRNLFQTLYANNDSTVLTNSSLDSTSFSSFISIISINESKVFLTYGRKETNLQRSGRAEIDINLLLSYPNYTTENNSVYIGYCVIDLTCGIGAFLSSGDVPPESCIKNVLLNHFPEVIIDILDIGKTRRELSELKKDIKKLTTLSFSAKNLTPNDLLIPFGRSLPIFKAKVNVTFNTDYISESQLKNSLDDFINSLDGDDGQTLLEKYDSLSFGTLSQQDFEQVIDLKRNFAIKKSAVTFPEKELYDSTALETIITAELDKFICDYNLLVS